MKSLLRLNFLACSILCIAITSCVWHGVDEQSTNLAFGGRAIGVEISHANEKVLWVATPTGGLFQSRNGGTLWRHIDAFPEFDCNDIKISPSDANVIIVAVNHSFSATRGGIWVTRDGGLSWQQPPSSVRPVNGFSSVAVKAECIAYAPNSAKVFVGTDKGVAESDDLGTNWTYYDPIPKAQTVVTSILALASGKVITYGPSGILMSDDGKTRWYTSATTLPNEYAYPASLAVSPLNDNHIFLLTGPDELFYSLDAGLNWKQIPFSPGTKIGGRQPYVIDRKSVNSNEVELYVSNKGTTYKNRALLFGNDYTFSKTWSPIVFKHEDPSDLAFSKRDSNLIYATDDGGVERSFDGGTTWELVGTTANNFNAIQIHDLRGVIDPKNANNNQLYFGTQDNSLWASSDNGNTWPIGVLNEGDNLQAPVTYDPTLAVGDYSMSLCYKNSSAENAFLHTHPLYKMGAPTEADIGDGGHAIMYINQNRFANFKAQLGSTSEGLFVSSDGCATWPSAPDVEIDHMSLNYIAASGPAANPSLIVPYYTTTAALMRIDNLFDGIAGNEIKNPIPLPANCQLQLEQRTYIANVIAFAADPADPNCIMIADLNAQKMLITYDGGVTWPEPPGLTNAITEGGKYNFPNLISIIKFDPRNSNHIIIGTKQTGLFLSKDHGKSWSKVAGSEKIPGMTAFFFSNDDEGWVSSYGRGLWKISFNILRFLRNRFIPESKLVTSPGDRETADAALRDTTSPTMIITKNTSALDTGKVVRPGSGMLVGARWKANGIDAQLQVLLDGKPLKKVNWNSVTGRFEVSVPSLYGEENHILEVKLMRGDQVLKHKSLQFRSFVGDDEAEENKQNPDQR